MREERIVEGISGGGMRRYRGLVEERGEDIGD